MKRIFARTRYKMENEIDQTVSTHGVMGSVCDIFVINTEGVALLRSYILDARII